MAATRQSALTATYHPSAASFSQSITVPLGTVMLVFMWLRSRADGALTSPTFGNVAMTLVGAYTLTGGSTTNHAIVYMYEFDATTARDDDVARWGSTGPNAEHVIAVDAILSTQVIVRPDEATGQTSATLDPSPYQDAIACVVAGAASSSGDVGEIAPYAGLTEQSEYATFGESVNFAYRTDVDSAITVGANVSDGSAKRGFVGALYAEGPSVTQPSAVGFEWGVVSPGPTVSVSADATLYPFPGITWEWGVVAPGPRVASAGPRQVMLTGEGIETPEMTDPPMGISVPVLRHRETDKPHWAGFADLASEAGIGGGASALDDLTDVNAPSPADNDVLSWSDGDSAWVAAAPSGGGLDTGTSFPVSPTTGDRYRRSDLDYQVFFYDGTRWLSEQLFTANSYYGGSSVAADYQTYIPLPVRSSLWLVRWSVAHYMSGAGQWDVVLASRQYGGVSATALGSISRTNAGPGWEHGSETLGDVYVMGAGNESAALSVLWDEVSGTSTFIGICTVEYRLIAT